MSQTRNSGNGRPPAGSGIHLAILVCLMLGAPVSSFAQQPAVVKLWNWDIHDKKCHQKMYKLFDQQRPDIKIEYSSISDTVYGQTLEAAIISQQAPDLFLPAGKYTFSYLRTKDLIMPLNDVAPNDKELKDWMALFPRY